MFVLLRKQFHERYLTLGPPVETMTTGSQVDMSDQALPKALPPVASPFVYSPLGVEAVRWYWLKPAFSLKGALPGSSHEAGGCIPKQRAATANSQSAAGVAAVYSVDVPHRAHLQRFCHEDSARLETTFRCAWVASRWGHIPSMRHTWYRCH